MRAVPVLRLLPVLALAAPLGAAALAPAATAQTVGARERLVLRDGTTITGTIVRVGDDSVVIDARGIRSEVPRDRIARVEAAGRFARADPNGTRLFVTPTARTMPRGSLRLSTVYVVVPNVAYGATGALDVSATATIPVDGTGLVSGNVKFKPFERGGAAFAVGVQAGTVYGDDFSGGLAGTFYGVGTFGDDTQALTVGAYGVYAGGASGNEDLEIGNGLGLVVGGEKQVSNSLKVITENAFAIPFERGVESFGITSLGVRFFGDRLAADAAVPLLALESGKIRRVEFPFPLVSLSYTIR